MDFEDAILVFEKAMARKCDVCGAELPRYPFYTETSEFVDCPKCGKRFEWKR